MRKIISLFSLLTLGFVIGACGGSKNKSSSKANLENELELVKAPLFNADSAYHYVNTQVLFGPRVPNTEGHKLCGVYLENKLKEFGATVTTQEVDLIAFDGTVLEAKNIIGAYQPEKKKRVALFAHWDTRPWSDNDADEKNYNTPVLGANDGASGVGVLLEIARLIQKEQPNLGVDIVFFDAEDYGAPQFYKGPHEEEYWGLGSQYWSRNPHITDYNARFGILLDMVGDKDAQFYYEGYSNEFAKSINKKVWKKAHELGFQHYFIKELGGYITDDHLFVNKIARIPTIDIIHNNIHHTGFAESWHTVNDTMDNIDKNTLQAVGQTVLEVIFNEK